MAARHAKRTWRDVARDLGQGLVVFVRAHRVAAIAVGLVSVVSVVALVLGGIGRGPVGAIARGPASEMVDLGSGRSESSRVGTHARSVDEVHEVVCWGDSLTEGVGADFAPIENDYGTYDASYLSYPEILADLTGLDVYNFGVAGATSEEIVAMRESLDTDPSGSSYEVYDAAVAELAQKHPGDILVLEIGSNGGWGGDYATLIDQYWEIIEYSECFDFIIVGDTDDPGTSVGDEGQREFEEGAGAGETDWEHALSREFGSHFVNMRVYLIDHGLKVCGLAPDEEDEELASQGRVPWQLRSDWTHLNSYGYYAKARGIFERGVSLGYWDGPHTSEAGA